MSTSTVPIQELETASLDLALPPLRDVFGVLHHSSQNLAVTRRLALPGQYLSFADAAGDEHLIPIAASLLHIGRSATAEIRIEDIRISRRHAIIARYAGQARVLDDASSAGTFVNGQRVIATNLSDGDVIRLGPAAFTYSEVR
jgi:pSer/pThr/pTyr-binding forkhead associated (FHA) protein